MAVKEDLEIKQLEKRNELYDYVLEAVKKGDIDMATLARAMSTTIHQSGCGHQCPCQQ